MKQSESIKVSLDLRTSRDSILEVLAMRGLPLIILERATVDVPPRLGAGLSSNSCLGVCGAALPEWDVTYKFIKKKNKTVGALQSGCRFITLARTISTLCDLFDFSNSL
jgi:hypothetical protein